MTIKFSTMLLGETHLLGSGNRYPTIKGTPPNLRDQLQRRTSGGN
ncbi:hypothetical protein ACLK1S_13575 [Escherichia coli]